MKQAIIFFFALVVVFSSCETEVDLNAPYKSTTIVFGLLNVDVNGDGLRNQLDTQWIKINRTFLGEGDNTIYAGIRDSSEYSEEDFVKKKVQQIDLNGNIVEFDLVAKTVSNRNVNGIFYGPEQTLYYFIPSPSGLNPNWEYRLLLEFTDGHVVESSTSLINSTGVTWVSPQTNATVILADVPECSSVNYTSEVALRWSAVSNASIYDATLRFHYTEEKLVGGVWTNGVDRFVDYYLGSVKQEDALNGQLKLTFDGRGFFAMLANKLQADTYTRRIIGRYNSSNQRTECFDVLLTMGNEDLNAYIDVNSPSTGLVQERPIYSNISNGIGLFASRGTGNLLGLPLVSFNNNNQPMRGNLRALKCSEYTSALNFCDPDGASQYPCE
jgi:hypothetical protein